MSKSEINITFREEMRAQDEVRGQLVSGRRFVGKVYGVANDYCQMVELQVENESGQLERVDLDIVKIRYDAILFFGHK